MPWYVCLQHICIHMFQHKHICIHMIHMYTYVSCNPAIASNNTADTQMYKHTYSTLTHIDTGGPKIIAMKKNTSWWGFRHHFVHVDNRHCLKRWLKHLPPNLHHNWEGGGGGSYEISLRTSTTDTACGVVTKTAPAKFAPQLRRCSTVEIWGKQRLKRWNHTFKQI